MNITERIDMYVNELTIPIPKKFAKWVVAKIKDKKILMKMVDGYMSEVRKKYPDGQSEKADNLEKKLRDMINSGEIKNALGFANYVKRIKLWI